MMDIYLGETLQVLAGGGFEACLRFPRGRFPVLRPGHRQTPRPPMAMNYKRDTAQPTTVRASQRRVVRP